jgi:hypothetical protein
VAVSPLFIKRALKCVLFACVILCVAADASISGLTFDKFGHQIFLGNIEDLIRGTKTGRIYLFNDAFMLLSNDPIGNSDKFNLINSSNYFLYLFSGTQESFVLNTGLNAGSSNVHVELRFDSDPVGRFHKLEFVSVGGNRYILDNFDGEKCIDFTGEGSILDAHYKTTELIKRKCKNSRNMYFSINGDGPYTTDLSGFTRAYEAAVTWMK